MPPILEVRHLKKRYSSVEAVRDVSFSVSPGICFGLLGPNGAGKTTTLEIIEDITPASGGEVLYRGRSRGRNFREEIGIQFQHTSLLNFLSVRETLETNLVGTMSGTAAVLPTLLAQGEGAIALVGSGAGYGGLPKATVYGPSKAALINFAEVLHLDLSPRGIGVFLIDPGFVATPLTAQNDFAMPALQTPAQAADAIVDGFARGDFEIHFPKRFTRVLKFLQLLPRRFYFALIRRATGV